MINVAFTTYPPGQGEQTTWKAMPFPPRVGESLHLGSDDIAIMTITHVCWCYDDATGWHVECSAR
jgi:hypothetical protein